MLDQNNRQKITKQKKRYNCLFPFENHCHWQIMMRQESVKFIRGPGTEKKMIKNDLQCIKLIIIDEVRFL